MSTAGPSSSAKLDHPRRGANRLRLREDRVAADPPQRFAGSPAIVTHSQGRAGLVEPVAPTKIRRQGEEGFA